MLCEGRQDLKIPNSCLTGRYLSVSVHSPLTASLPPEDAADSWLHFLRVNWGMLHLLSGVNKQLFNKLAESTQKGIIW